MFSVLEESSKYSVKITVWFFFQQLGTEIVRMSKQNLGFKLIFAMIYLAVRNLGV